MSEQLDAIADKLGRQFSAVEAMLRDAQTDICAFAVFPTGALAQCEIWSTNPLERVNKEIKRRTNVVGIFPNEPAVVRLAGSELLEVHERMGRHRPSLPLRRIDGEDLRDRQR